MCTCKFVCTAPPCTPVCSFLCVCGIHLPSIFPKTCLDNAATPEQGILSCFMCYNKKPCAGGEINWLLPGSALLVFPLFFLLSPTIDTSPPSPQLLSYPKHVVLASLIQGWVKNLLLLQGLGKAKQTWLCSHFESPREDIQVPLKAKFLSQHQSHSHRA